MNIITSIINFLIILLIGTPTPKRDLHKKATKKEEFSRILNCWIERNFYIICFISIIFLLIIFVMFCFWIVGVSALESGAMRNFINGGMV